MSTISSECLANSPLLDSTALLRLSEKLQRISSAKQRAEVLLPLISAQETKELINACVRYCEVENKEESFSLLLVELILIYQFLKQPLPPFQKLISQAKELSEAHRFYYPQGGLIHYQSELQNQLQEPQNSFSVDLFPPRPIKIEELSASTKAQWIKLFYDHFDEYAEFYPIGGAADRLNSSLDPDASPLPAAKLPFCNQFLLERLLCDLQAKEEMHYKLTGKRVDVPIVLMTSLEQKNHQMIHELLESHSYFGKKKESIKIISQPLVPASDERGRWIFLEEGKVMLRPAGHGIFWQLLQKEGILHWLEKRGIKRALIRQINNPIAGLDDLLTLLVGCGISKDKEFGFASTHFAETTNGSVQEGCNVVMRTTSKEGCFYALSNLEYTHPEFSKEGEKEWYKIANANLLYIDLQKGKEKIEQFTPPTFVNRKKTKLSQDGIVQEKVVVRLETTIQSISESFTYVEKETLQEVPHDNLPAFLLLQKRSKTLSAIKKMGASDGVFEKDTPELCLSHFQKEAAHVLKSAGFTLPESSDREIPFIFLYRALLGPYYSVICQKIKKGMMALGSEFICDLGEIEIENLALKGSFLIEQMKGKTGPSFTRIKDLKIENAGLGEGSVPSLYWKGEFVRKEMVRIELGSFSELDVEGVTLRGSHQIQVPDHCKLTLRQKGNELVSTINKISIPSRWNYRLQGEGFLLKKENSQ